MAHFLALLDPDRDRARRVGDAARSALGAEAGLRIGALECRDLEVIWAAHPDAPVCVYEESVAGAVVWGEPLDGRGAPADAAAVLSGWGREPEEAEPHDGYFAAVGRTPETPLVVEADLLGLFPIYHVRAGEVVLVGTSPTLLHLHPLARPALDLEGLLGILLTGGPVQGRTVWSGMRRLSPGHLLVAGPGRELREIHQFTPPRTTDLHALPFPEQVAELDRAVRGAVARQARRRPSVLLLSGGRDSRLLGAVLQAEGTPLRALTLGREGDDEVYCARRVARALGASHMAEDLPPDAYTGHARRWARWEHMVGSASGLYTWHYPTLLASYEERLVVNGVLLELVVGGVQGRWIRVGGDPSEAGSRSIPAPRLRTLLRPGLRQAVDAVWSAVRDEYEVLTGDEARRDQLFDYRHWLRYHAGSVPWRTAFGAWPVLPVLDRHLLALGGALPSSTTADRRAQDELLRTRYRAVARAPLERHTGDLTPLHTGLSHRAWAGVSDRLPFLRRFEPAGPVESYVRRIYDPNGPGWQAVRRSAEPYRERVLDLLDPEALERFLPPPPARIEVEDPVADAFGQRRLVGLMLWAGEHRS